MNSPHEVPPPSLGDAIILVVDDVAANRQVLGTVLRKAGYRVLSADSAHQAMHQVNLQVPDLILLDIMMPGIDGYTLGRRLQAEPRTQKVPLIFLSALTGADDKVKAFALGGADYVAKPFQAEEVLARVEHQLKIKRLQSDLEREKAELVRMNQKLMAAERKTAAVFTALTENLPGSVLDGKYRIEEKIGSGGFGVVYRATHVGLDRLVAIKVFRPPGQESKFDALSRFQLEGVSTSRIHHPNAVMVLDSGLSPQGIAYLVMELLQGPTLYAEMLQNRQLSLKRGMEIIIPLCDVLITAHAAEIVHRDVKPENIMLHQTSQGEIVKVLDFGIAKLLGEEPHHIIPVATTRNEVIGTPIYMAPERFDGSEYDGRSDVYSTGILLYEMLAGQLPFHDRNQTYFKVAFNHMHGNPTPLRTYRPDLSEKWEMLLRSAFIKDPAQRPTAQQFRDGLSELMKEEGPQPTSPVISAGGSPGQRMPAVLSKKEAEELLQQWNAGESNPFVEYVVKLDPAELG